MVWARIPPDRLVHLPLFGIDTLQQDGDLLWLRGPSGRICVDVRAPRIWFEDVGDAMQAGATALRISSREEEEALKAFADKLPPGEELENDEPEEGQP